MINSKYCLLIPFFSIYTHLSQNPNIAGKNELDLFFHLRPYEMGCYIKEPEYSSYFKKADIVAILTLLDNSKLQRTKDEMLKIPIGELRIILIDGLDYETGESVGNIEKLQEKLESATKLVEFFNEKEEFVQNRKISQQKNTNLAPNKISLKATNDFWLYREPSNPMVIISHLEVELEPEDIVINHVGPDPVGLSVNNESKIHVKMSMDSRLFICDMVIKKISTETMKILEELSNPKKKVSKESKNVNVIGSNENSDSKEPPEAAGSPESSNASIKPEPKTPSKTPSNETPFYRKGWFLFVVVALIGCLVIFAVGYYRVMENRKRYVTKTSRQKK